jgi:hypothetical protein
VAEFVGRNLWLHSQGSPNGETVPLLTRLAVLSPRDFMRNGAEYEMNHHPFSIMNLKVSYLKNLPCSGIFSKSIVPVLFSSTTQLH